MADPDAEAIAKLRRWRADPILFVRECLRAEPDDWQGDTLEAYPDQERLSLKACAGPGKSALLAFVIWHFLVCFSYPRIAVTSITWDNLRDNLWSELAKWRDRSPFLLAGFEWTQTRIFNREAPDRWWASARTWKPSASPDTQGATLAGLHEKNAMAIVDEAGGVPSAVVASALGVLATEELGSNHHVIVSGNPTHLTGPLWDADNAPPGLWWTRHITGDPDDPRRAKRVSMQWARDMIAQYGRDSNIVRVRVLGLHPKHASDALISFSDFEEAYGRTHDKEGTELARGRKILGVDVARFGADDSVVAKRDGAFLDGFEDWNGHDTVASTNHIERIALDYGAEEIRIDDIGVGGGITDQLMKRQAIREAGIVIIGVNVGSAPTKLGPRRKPRYKNLRAQIGMEMREELFGPGRISLAECVRDTTLQAEGSDMRYGFDRGGQVFQIEPKEEYKRRHSGKSPDRWDAMELAFCEGMAPHAGLLGRMREMVKAERDEEEVDAA